MPEPDEEYLPANDLMFGDYIQLLNGFDLGDPLGVTLNPQNAEILYSATNPYGAMPGTGTSDSPSKNRTQLSGIATQMADSMLRGLLGPEFSSPYAFQPIAEPVSQTEQEAYQRYNLLFPGGSEPAGLNKVVVDLLEQNVPRDQIGALVAEFATSEQDEATQAALRDRWGLDPDSYRQIRQAVEQSLPRYLGSVTDGGVTAFIAGTNNSLNLSALMSDIDQTIDTVLLGAPLYAGVEAGQYTLSPTGELMELAPSPQMEKFDSLGLPYPTERYGQGRFAPPGLAQEQAALQAYEDAQKLFDQSVATNNQMRQRAAGSMSRPADAPLSEREYRGRMGARDRNVPTTRAVGVDGGEVDLTSNMIDPSLTRSYVDSVLPDTAVFNNDRIREIAGRAAQSRMQRDPQLAARASGEMNTRRALDLSRARTDWERSLWDGGSWSPNAIQQRVMDRNGQTPLNDILRGIVGAQSIAGVTPQMPRRENNPRMRQLVEGLSPRWRS